MSMAVRLYAVFLSRSLSTCPVLCAGQKWRVSKGLARSGNEYGPLTDLPDWSYANGQPAPDSKRKIARQRRREAVATRVLTLTQEMNEAKKKAYRDEDT
ncbi:large ribosomal subunit protein mL52-like [Corticium candelabrum]|uniref:large ribosomal subunit protein mL52-like n=1 Tax=Corticium candelabrum TaxID=121492 RepID=UPI002E2572F3|nr:large ribosomal subunit protein mL52-like [Corticium candelabrum]